MDIVWKCIISGSVMVETISHLVDYALDCIISGLGFC